MTARWWLIVALLLACVPAHAQVEIDAALDGQSLDRQVRYLFDPSGALSFDEVRRKRDAFRALDGPSLHFGVAREGACWLRIPVRNRGDRPRTWMLEVGYPHLDALTLYLPGERGVARQQAGDMAPFGARPYRHHNFVFVVEEAAGSERDLYLRVVTHGVLYVPLRAWEEQRFAEHHYLASTPLLAFYGVALLMAAYNLLLFALSRLPEYGLFAFVVFTEGFSLFVSQGHGFQLLVPDAVDIAQRLVPFSMILTIFANCLFATHQLFELLPRWVHRAAKILMPITALGALLTLVVPFSVVVVLIWFCYHVLVPFAALVAVSWKLRNRAQDRLMAAWTNAVAFGWLSVLLGLLVSSLTVNGLLPRSAWTAWAPAVGATLQIVLITAALASRVRWLQRDLAGVNAALQRRVSELGAAIDLTQTETARAEAAVHAKNEVIATMTHELRTPLNAIINIPEGLAERLREVPGARCDRCGGLFALETDQPLTPDAGCPTCEMRGSLAPTIVVEHVGNPAQSARYLEIVEKAGRHLLQVIDGILEGTHESRGLNAVMLDVVPMLDEVIEQMSVVAAKADVRLRLRLAQPALWLSVDAMRFRQIVINLIGNAIKFSPRGSEVTVSARVEGAHARFSVTDRGIGIPEAKRASVFETFEQAHDRRFGGTGLGLSIVRSLVRLHGGEVWLESEVGRGTTFHFSMPVRREAAA